MEYTCSYRSKNYQSPHVRSPKTHVEHLYDNCYFDIIFMNEKFNYLADTLNNSQNVDWATCLDPFLRSKTFILAMTMLNLYSRTMNSLLVWQVS